MADDELGQTREKPGLPLAEEYSKAFAEIDGDSNQYLAVAVESGAVIGTLQLTFIPGLARLGARRGQIEAVRIAKSHRGSGLGHRLFEWAIEKCQENNCSLVQLTSDKAREKAHKFYDDLGFVASHEGYKMKL